MKKKDNVNWILTENKDGGNRRNKNVQLIYWDRERKEKNGKNERGM